MDIFRLAVTKKIVRDSSSGGGGGEGIGANISIKSGICPVIPTQILIERPTINIEGTGRVEE